MQSGQAPCSAGAQTLLPSGNARQHVQLTSLGHTKQALRQGGMLPEYNDPALGRYSLQGRNCERGTAVEAFWTFNRGLGRRRGVVLCNQLVWSRLMEQGLMPRLGSINWLSIKDGGKSQPFHSFFFLPVASILFGIFAHSWTYFVRNPCAVRSWSLDPIDEAYASFRGACSLFLRCQQCLARMLRSQERAGASQLLLDRPNTMAYVIR